MFPSFFAQFTPMIKMLWYLHDGTDAKVETPVGTEVESGVPV